MKLYKKSVHFNKLTNPIGQKESMSLHSSIASRDIFGELGDPGKAAKVRYPLNGMIPAALCASIRGADTFVYLRILLMQGWSFKKISAARKCCAKPCGVVFSNKARKKSGERFVKWVEGLRGGFLVLWQWIKNCPPIKNL